MAHTPGPWKLEFRTIYALHVPPNPSYVMGVPRETKVFYCPVQGNGEYGSGPEELLDNARLIVESPELLGALKDMLPEGWDDGTMDHMPGVKRARMVISRVEGRQ